MSFYPVAHVSNFHVFSPPYSLTYVFVCVCYDLSYFTPFRYQQNNNRIDQRMDKKIFISYFNTHTHMKPKKNNNLYTRPFSMIIRGYNK